MAQERRVVTVLFADVAGSTKLGAEEDPEDVRALMSAYFAAASAVISEHGGTIEKFIGDAVMAVFGLPRAHGDDASRAIAAAMALRERINVDPELRRLQLRFGLATGEVVGTRDTAGGEFLVTGDAVNVAARMQQAAEPGSIVVTDRTAWDAREQFEFGAPARIEIAGRVEPVVARRLLGPVGSATRRAASPFVGREDELAQLRLTARRAFRDRVPAVVSIVAPAGTGKSRLVEEFLRATLPDLAPEATVETAQCLPYGSQLTYWPLRTVLFNLAGFEGTDRSVADAVEGWLGDRRDAELLAATVGAESAASADPTELFAAWRSAFARAAADRPLVVVFEDLHWSSDSLLDLVEFVMDPRESVPMLIVAIARPELIDRRPTWGGGRRNFVAIYLDPLSESDIAELVGPLLEGASSEVVNEVVKRSEGNPFFAGELAQAALERGGEALPDTVQATVLARLDLLAEGARRLLQVASIFGRTFRPEGLRAIAPELDGREGELIDALTARDLLRRQDAGHLSFRHILIREVAYSTLPRVERSRLHAAAGDWYEERAAGREEEVAEIVALHFREAVSFAGSRSAARPGLRQKAAKWLLLAGDTAIRAAATREAESHLRAALELVDDPDEAAEIWARLGEVLRILPGGFEAYQQSARLARSPVRRLAALGGLLICGMRYVRVDFKPEQIDAAIVEGTRLTAEVHDPALEAKFLTGVGFQPNWALQHGVQLEEATFDRAQASAKRAAELAESLGELNLLSAALDALGACAMYSGDWNGVLAQARRRRAYGARLQLAEIMDADHMATWSFCMLGDPNAAEAVNAESSARLRPGQAPEWRLSTLSWRLRIDYTLGRWSHAMEAADQFLTVWRQLGSPLLGWMRVGLRPGLLVSIGRMDGARSQAMAASFRAAMVSLGLPAAAYDAALVDGDIDAIAGSISSLTDTGFAPMMLADAFGQLSDAGRLGAAVIEGLPDKVKNVPLLAPQMRRALGLAARDATELHAALEVARRFADLPAEARVSVELGRLSQDPALIERGRRLLVEMGDVRQLERYGLA
ncbi:MAG TPA: adenylate/guanylate cyclase domain-containing protein [Candidatus Dormibacteraeota bacterium]|nr:adenylate/guanylate cyclase domain-containing protein [Candidatus Dormibacteraeota bacterium]